MAGINDVAGVCVGGVLGHTICTGLAGQYCQHTLISVFIVKVLVGAFNKEKALVLVGAFSGHFANHH